MTLEFNTLMNKNSSFEIFSRALNTVLNNKVPFLIRKDLEILKELIDKKEIFFSSNEFDKEIYQLKDEVRDSKYKADNFERECIDLKYKVNDLKEQLDTLQSQYDELEKDFESLQFRNDGLNGKITDLNCENINLRNKIQFLENKIDNLRNG